MEPVIVYVEDDEFSRLVMEITLKQRMGYNNLFIFEDSTDFMERVTQLPAKPALFLLDIHVEPLNGFEMLKLLRHHDDYKTIMMVALTASVMNEEVEELEAAGFNGVISKPIAQASFPDIIERILHEKPAWVVY